MTTAYSSLLGLALPVTGELSGTWGDTVNNYITNYLDAAVAGTQTISTDADVTLTKTTGTSLGATSSQYAVINCTGARTALRTITAPAASKVYTIINATTGGYSVKLVGAGPTTGITIPNGASAVVAWNGSDFVEIGSGTIGSLTVNGNLSVTGNTTLGDAAGDTTTVSGPMTLSAGTANGVLYLNGSKVATSGTGLVFDGSNLGLGVTPSAWNAAIRAVQLCGTSSTGTATLYSNGANAGVVQNAIFDTAWKYVASAAATRYDQTAGTHAWSYAASGTAGNAITFTTAMTLDSSGNLGVGASSPSVRLHVRGSGTTQALLASTSDTTTYLRFENTGFAGGYIGYSNDSLIFLTGGNTKATLDSAGNLGLGVTPSAWGSNFRALELQYSSGASVVAGLYPVIAANTYNDNTNWIYKTTAAASYYSQVLGQHRWYNAPSGTAGNAITFTQAMTLDASGNLGLGVTPSAWQAGTGAIDFNNQQSFGKFGYVRNAYYDGTNYIYKTSSYASAYQQSSGTHFWYTAPSGTAGSSFTFTEQMRLDASGNLGLGVTPSAWGNVYKALQVGAQASVWASASSPGGAYFSNNAYFDNTNYRYISSNAAAQFTVGSDGSFNWKTAASGTAGNAITFTQAMTLENSGNLGIGTASPNQKLEVRGTVRAGLQSSSINGTVLLDDSYSGSESLVSVNTLRSTGGLLLGAGVMQQENGANIVSTTGISLAKAGLFIENGTLVFKNAAAAAVARGTAVSLTTLMTLDASGYLTLNSASATLAFKDFSMQIYRNTNDMVFYTGSAERARITSGGDLLVGTTNAAATTGVGVKTIASGSVYAVGATSDYFSGYNSSAGAFRFYVGISGTISATNTTISAISDQRLKENIRDIDAGLDKIMALKPRKFDWKAGKGQDKKDVRGFIAQEFEQVFPDLIDEWKDPAPEGEEPYKAVRADLIPVLVKAIQEQQALITDLRARVAALEAA